jgi:hypothetical protein
MRIEFEKIKKIKNRVVEKFKDIKRGHTLQEEADVRRIISGLSTISEKDIYICEGELQDNAMFGEMSVLEAIGGKYNVICPTESRREAMVEIENLTPAQLEKIVINKALKKARAWGIISNA